MMPRDRPSPLAAPGADPSAERDGNTPWGAPPFALALAELGGPTSELLVQRVVRRIPAKRLACFARWQGAEVFAKIFFDRAARERHWKRDERGVRAMLAHGIATSRQARGYSRTRATVPTAYSPQRGFAR